MIDDPVFQPCRINDLLSRRASTSLRPDGSVFFCASARYGAEVHANFELIQGEDGVLSSPGSRAH